MMATQGSNEAPSQQEWKKVIEDGDGGKIKQWIRNNPGILRYNQTFKIYCYT